MIQFYKHNVRSGVATLAASPPKLTCHRIGLIPSKHSGIFLQIVPEFDFSYVTPPFPLGSIESTLSFIFSLGMSPPSSPKTQSCLHRPILTPHLPHAV